MPLLPDVHPVHGSRIFSSSGIYVAVNEKRTWYTDWQCLRSRRTVVTVTASLVKHRQWSLYLSAGQCICQTVELLCHETMKLVAPDMWPPNSPHIIQLITAFWECRRKESRSTKRQYQRVKSCGTSWWERGPEFSRWSSWPMAKETRWLCLCIRGPFQSVAVT